MRVASSSPYFGGAGHCRGFGFAYCVRWGAAKGGIGRIRMLQAGIAIHRWRGGGGGGGGGSTRSMSCVSQRRIVPETNGSCSHSPSATAQGGGGGGGGRGILHARWGRGWWPHNTTNDPLRWRRWRERRQNTICINLRRRHLCRVVADGPSTNAWQTRAQCLGGCY